MKSALNRSRPPICPRSRRKEIPSPYARLRSWRAKGHPNFGSPLTGTFLPAPRRSCPFRTEGLWEYGEAVRSSTLEVEFVGVTGSLAFIDGEDVVLNAAGAAGSGWRQANGTTFCALNMQPHASLGATLVAMSSWQPKLISDTTGAYEPFQVRDGGGRYEIRVRVVHCTQSGVERRFSTLEKLKYSR